MALSVEQRQAVMAALRAGRRAEAERHYRLATGCSPLQARLAVAAMIEPRPAMRLPRAAAVLGLLVAVLVATPMLWHLGGDDAAIVPRDQWPEVGGAPGHPAAVAEDGEIRVRLEGELRLADADGAVVGVGGRRATLVLEYR